MQPLVIISAMGETVSFSPNLELDMFLRDRFRKKTGSDGRFLHVQCIMETGGKTTSEINERLDQVQQRDHNKGRKKNTGEEKRGRDFADSVSR